MAAVAGSKRFLLFVQDPPTPYEAQMLGIIRGAPATLHAHLGVVPVSAASATSVPQEVLRQGTPIMLDTAARQFTVAGQPTVDVLNQLLVSASDKEASQMQVRASLAAARAAAAAAAAVPTATPPAAVGAHGGHWGAASGYGAPATAASAGAGAGAAPIAGPTTTGELSFAGGVGAGVGGGMGATPSRGLGGMFGHGGNAMPDDMSASAFASQSTGARSSFDHLFSSVDVKTGVDASGKIVPVAEASGKLTDADLKAVEASRNMIDHRMKQRMEAQGAHRPNPDQFKIAEVSGMAVADTPAARRELAMRAEAALRGDQGGATQAPVAMAAGTPPGTHGPFGIVDRDRPVYTSDTDVLRQYGMGSSGAPAAPPAGVFAMPAGTW
jgi:hypothetical protein